ncbi:ribonuclease HII [Thermanaeromonas sp. C210]|uniref:ribonuclease HII n=1 Tax=Thermanaeromonas sp. C210 TaxID=2731925 RepID=UPI00155D3781|nr:ribonuclease HII [Thermanaeromonas sp. C210]GFN23953.1 ribonuclease HII [Thermanaeromonas sp. C210]
MGRELYRLEEQLAARGIRYIAGVDEVGRGPLAGPVAAGAVILPPGFYLAELVDSKKLSPGRRKRLAVQIMEKSLAWAVGWASVLEIDCLNIAVASRLAMQRAVAGLAITPEHILVDAFYLPGINIPQTPLIAGDNLSASIAAAAILAKVARDKLMEDYDRVFPGYGFGRHKGYPTREHRAALAALGPTPIHRHSFRLKGVR